MKSYSNEWINGTLEIAGKVYGGSGSLVALGAVNGDASTLTGATTPNAGNAASANDKLDLYNGQYGLGLQSNRLVCYVWTGAAFAVRQAQSSGVRSAGTDAVTLFANGNVTAVGTVTAANLTATTAVTGPSVTVTGTRAVLGINGYNRDDVLPLGVGAKISHDRLRFKVPTLVEVSASASSPSWTTSGAPTVAAAQTALAGRTDLSTLTLTTALPGVRLTGTGIAAVYSSHVLVGVGFSSGVLIRVIWEESPDGSTWTTRADTTSGLDCSTRWIVLPAGPQTGDDYWRITLLATTISANAVIKSIQLLSGRPGDQGSGEQSDVPYTWDANKKLITTTASATSAGLQLAHGTAPTTPFNGDVWTTTSGVFARVNSVTKDLTRPVNVVGPAGKSNYQVALPDPATGNRWATVTLTKSGQVIRPPGQPGLVTIGASGRVYYAASSITGDLDVRVKLAPDSWTPAANGVIAAKSIGNSGVNTWGWVLYAASSTGLLNLLWSPDGTFASRITVASSAAPSFTAGQAGWVRVTIDVDDGAGHNVVTFYTSTDGSSWTQLGLTRTQTGTTSIYDNTTIPFTLGNYSGGGANMLGDVIYAEIRNGIAGTNAVPTDPSTWTVEAGTVTVFAALTPTAGTSVALAVTQDATGSRTVTWPSSVKWPGGTAPTLTTTASAIDWIQLDCVDGTNWYGRTLGLDVK